MGKIYICLKIKTSVQSLISAVACEKANALKRKKAK